MKTVSDVLRWAQAQLASVRQDLELLDRGIDLVDGDTAVGETGRRATETMPFLGGQEDVVLRLIEGLTGEKPAPRIVKPAWKPRDGKRPGTIEWTREGVSVRDEQCAPHHERWVIVATLPDGRRVATCHAATLTEAMDKGDADVECAAAWAKEKVELDKSPGAVERRRGHSDAVAGHGPALFDGPYMVGYRRGRAETGQPMEHKPAKGEF